MLYLISKGFSLSFLVQLLFLVSLGFATNESRNDLNKLKKKTVGQRETLATWVVMLASSTKYIVVVRFASLREAKYFSASALRASVLI